MREFVAKFVRPRLQWILKWTHQSAVCCAIVYDTIKWSASGHLYCDVGTSSSGALYSRERLICLIRGIACNCLAENNFWHCVCGAVWALWARSYRPLVGGAADGYRRSVCSCINSLCLCLYLVGWTNHFTLKVTMQACGRVNNSERYRYSSMIHSRCTPD